METYFRPYVGEQYAYSQTKIMVLGDSHYCGECPQCGIRGMQVSEMGDCCHFTENVQQKYLNYLKGEIQYESWMKSLATFDKILSGDVSMTKQQRYQAWKSLLFYNFVQTAASGAPANTAYTYEEYQRSLPYAWSIVEQYQPDLIIVWGNRVYDTLPDKGWHSIKDGESGYYCLSNGHVVKIVKIKHPSRASIEDNHQRIVDILHQYIG